MPETTAAYIASATLTASSTLTYTQILYATYAAYAVASISYSNSQRRKMERRARDASNASLKDRNLTARGTIETRQLVLGRVRTGGAVAFIGSTGSLKEKLTIVVALASHRIAGIDAVYFDDELVPLDANGYVTSGTYAKQTTEQGVASMTITAGVGSVTLPYTPTGPVQVTQDTGDDVTPVVGTATVVGNVASVSSFGGGSGVAGTATVLYQYLNTTPSTTSRARVRWMLGGADQAVFADLVTQFPAEWTSAHRGRGVAYLVAELDFDPDIYPSGIPNISAVVRGADEVFDPRTNTTGYTENPALLMRHYLLHPFGGKRTAAQLDDTSFVAAANVCDQSVNYGTGSTALYTAGYVAGTEQTPAAVCDELAEAMAGRWGYAGGVVRVRAGAVGAAVADINASWLAEGTLAVQPRLPRAQLGNVMQGTFIDPASNWQQVQFPRVPVGAEAAALLVEDGGAELAQDVEFGAITRAGQAQQVAAVLLREARQGLTVTLDCNMRAYTLQMFDVVSLTLPRYGWAGKLFEVVSRSFTLGGAIRLVLRETGSSVYAFGTSFGTTDALPNTSLPNPWQVPTMGAVTASSGPTVLPDGSVVSRVVLTWAAPADSNVLQGGYIELGYRDGSSGGGDFQTVRADSFSGHTLVGLRGGRGYVFMLRAVNGLGVRGQWGPLTAHTVYLVRGPRIFRQTSTPTGDVRNGDTWFDTDAGNLQYVREAGAWVVVRDAGIQAALDAAAAAQAAADGKIDSFYQASAPGTASEGDLWFDTDDGNRQYIRQAGVWVVAADTRIGDALTAASDAQATADGKVVTFVQTTAPTAEAVGDLWLDSDDGNRLYRWSGSAWVALPVGTGAIAAGAATEVNVDEFDFAGATYGTTTARTVSYTPAVDCVVEVSAKLTATNLVGDSGNNLAWTVTPSGGSELILGGSETSSTAKQEVTVINSFSATGGVALSFALKVTRPGGNPAIGIFKSYLRVTFIKR